jgi:cbb3-type cytochrome oxidase subunit 1
MKQLVAQRSSVTHVTLLTLNFKQLICVANSICSIPKLMAKNKWKLQQSINVQWCLIAMENKIFLKKKIKGGFK